VFQLWSGERDPRARLRPVLVRLDRRHDWRLAAMTVLALCLSALAAQCPSAAWPLALILVSTALAVSARQLSTTDS
jgi:hypothetical protein